MSLRFIFGPSGAGKSRKLYQELMERSLAEPDRNFLMLVPDQFTMQTQKDLVTFHERGGILNIDVLSFGRLAHRIFDEVGAQDTPVLDDTGKSLVLQKVALGLKEELPVLGGQLHRQGYIHEVKSALSEFMQYGISSAGVEAMAENAGKRGALAGKLRDLSRLYRGFQEYIQGRFITTEETLDVLRRSLERSALLRNSVVVFDGFTGFTPIQNRVIQEIMRLSPETVVSLTLGEGENPYLVDGEQKLFYLTKKTVQDLSTFAKEAGVGRGQDVFVARGEKDRFGESPALRHLEQNLFRYGVAAYAQEQKNVRVMEMSTVAAEVHHVGLEILRLVREEGFAYRDIALVNGNLEGYAPYIESQFRTLQIPCYVDRTRRILLNPMIEYINSALELFLKDFSYESVFHYLRSGLSDIAPERTDILENYVIQTGIRGYSKWSRLFVHKTAQMGEDEAPLQELNSIREQLMEQLAPLKGKKKDSAMSYVNQLYDFLVENRVQEKLAGFERHFTGQGDLTRAGEYAQIWRLVMDLLDQIYELLGDEIITLQEFAEILEAGFAEIQVGTIPQNVDRIMVGDMERSRLKQVKALFFLGVNDGNIPKNASKGGILSDMDREFLRDAQVELAPTPRQQMFIQRLYLYLNMTKPSDYLYLSYAKTDSQGKSMRPAYLIDMIAKLFPGKAPVEYPENRPMLDMVVTPAEGVDYLARELRLYVQGSGDREQELLTLYAAYGETDGQRRLRERLTEAAFKRYRESTLSEAVARALYGVMLENSVSRLETYAACAYRHFLKYGLSLKEREEFGFESVDMGNVYHDVLEKFSRALKESEYNWFTFPEEFGRQKVREALLACAALYGDTVLYSSARSEYAITRMERVLNRTVLTLQEQLKRGDFVPDRYEMAFHHVEDLESVQVALSEQERMRLQGRIDRIDVAEDEEHVYVKVIDYKSGNRRFDIAALYYGLQLQLVVYMNAALEYEAKKHPDKDIVPAALLYYHVEDPVVEAGEELDDAALNEQILAELRMRGVVNGSDEVLRHLDRDMDKKSSVIAVERKKDGGFSAYSDVMGPEGLQTISDYVNYKMGEIGQEILAGHIALNPSEHAGAKACTYCEYKKVCGFDKTMPGHQERMLHKLDAEEALARMQADMAGEIHGD